MNLLSSGGSTYRNVAVSKTHIAFTGIVFSVLCFALRSYSFVPADTASQCWTQLLPITDLPVKLLLIAEHNTIASKITCCFRDLRRSAGFSNTPTVIQSDSQQRFTHKEDSSLLYRTENYIIYPQRADEFIPDNISSPVVASVSDTPFS